MVLLKFENLRKAHEQARGRNCPSYEESKTKYQLPEPSQPEVKVDGRFNQPKSRRLIGGDCVPKKRKLILVP